MFESAQFGLHLSGIGAVLSFAPAERTEIIRGGAGERRELADNCAIFSEFSRSAPALLDRVGMLRRGFFRREVETVLRVAGCTIVLSAFATTFAWGYHQRQQAQAWREQACAHRFAEVARRATFLGDNAGGACVRLQTLGLDMRVSGLAGPSVSEDPSGP
jgi:hypothetical protein